MAKRKKKKETSAVGTTTSDIAVFQKRWGPVLTRRRKRKIQNMDLSYDDQDTDNENVVTAALGEITGSGMRLGIGTIEEPSPYDHPLNLDRGELSSEDSPKMSDKTEKNPRKREKEIRKRVRNRNKEALPESTTSGQAIGSPTTGAVAGTDTRFGAPSWEPVFFDEPTNAISNEKKFYLQSNKAVLLPGFEYVEDYAKKVEHNIRTKTSLSNLRFSPEEISTVELDDKDNSAMATKARFGVDWKLDGPKHNYKKLLQKLRKIHNI